MPDCVAGAHGRAPARRQDRSEAPAVRPDRNDGCRTPSEAQTGFGIAWSANVNLDLLKRLCETPGIPGREDRIRAVVIEELRPLVDELRVDALGNVVAVKR